MKRALKLLSQESRKSVYESIGRKDEDYAVIYDYSEANGPLCIVPIPVLFSTDFVEQKRGTNAKLFSIVICTYDNQNPHIVELKVCAPCKQVV